jgi:hypothetical protein
VGPPVPIFKCFKIRGTAGSDCFFENLKDPSGFMKELAVFWGWQYDFSQQNSEKLFSTVYFSQL